MNRTLIVSLAALLGASPIFAADPAQKKPIAAKGAASLKTDQEKTLYVMGVIMGYKMSSLRLSEAELQIVKAGLTDAVQHRSLKADTDAYGPRIEEMVKIRAGAFAADQKKAEQPQLEKLAVAKGAVRKPSGLIYTEVKAGSGATPKLSDKVKVQETGSLLDGTPLFKGPQPKEPKTFLLEQVFPPCWKEALQLMKAGGKARIVCPSDLAFGDRGFAPEVKPGAAVIFDLELLDIVK